MDANLKMWYKDVDESLELGGIGLSGKDWKWDKLGLITKNNKIRDDIVNVLNGKYSPIPKDVMVDDMNRIVLDNENRRSSNENRRVARELIKLANLILREAASPIDTVEKAIKQKLKDGRNVIKGYPVDIDDSVSEYISMTTVDRDAGKGLFKYLKSVGLDATLGSNGVDISIH